MGPKVVGIPTLGISELPLGSPRTKCHLDVGLVERYKLYYKGEGGGFLTSLGLNESCESEFAHGSSQHQKCSNYALTTLCLVLCKSM